MSSHLKLPTVFLIEAPVQNGWMYHVISSPGYFNVVTPGVLKSLCGQDIKGYVFKGEMAHLRGGWGCSDCREALE